MPEDPVGEPRSVAPFDRLIAKAKDFVRSFLDLREAPWAFWCVLVFFTIDSMAYFGVLTLMESFIQKDFGVGDIVASTVVSLFTLLVTLFMIGLGSVAEKRGIRGGLLLAILLCLIGRAAYSSGPLGGLPHWLSLTLLLGGLVVVAVGEGMVQPVAYAGVKLYTSSKTSSMGYSLIYALMNLGIVVSALVSTSIRVPVQNILAARAAGTPEPPSIWRFFADWGFSGMNAVNWAFVAITAIALLFLLFGLTTRAAAASMRSESAEPPAQATSTAPARSWSDRLLDYFAEGPFANGRFLFFIFMLLPVQTLFAHQWLTMPAYVLRDYSQEVADKMEWIVNWINPGIIFIGAPIIAALTRRVNVYTLMIVGSAVSAIPTFLLCMGANIYLLIVYLVLFSIGEALWSPRFLQYAAELAPEGKVAQYMGLASVPWLLAKGTTGFYSGYFLTHYCPEQGPRDTPTMWLIYGLIALLSPIGLLIGRGWVMRGKVGGLQSRPA